MANMDPKHPWRRLTTTLADYADPPKPAREFSGLGAFLIVGAIVVPFWLAWKILKGLGILAQAVAKHIAAKNLRKEQ